MTPAVEYLESAEFQNSLPLREWGRPMYELLTIEALAGFATASSTDVDHLLMSIDNRLARVAQLPEEIAA